MIIQEVYLPKYDWYIKVYYSVDDVYIEEILKDLINIECPESTYNEIKNFLNNFDYNDGITYSSFKFNSSIVVIGPTTSAEQFQDTFDHEKGHLTMHIASALSIHPLSETYQYLSGEIGKKLFRVARKFLCRHCRNNISDMFSKER